MFVFLGLTFPNIDPVALELGPLVIRWYALAYVAGIMLAWRYVIWINQRMDVPLMTKEQVDDLVMYTVFGVILGGRLGYILFYQAGYYLENPGDILKVWHGGMSFHGGLAGVLISFWVFAKRRGIRWLALMDHAAAATPIGLFFGRCANFVNGELFGRPTDAPVGMIFPHGGPLPRHPSQLYEAGLEGLLLLFVLFLLVRYTRALEKTGMIGGAFLFGYGASRFIVEFFREPDEQLGLFFNVISMGQILCMPMILVGGCLILRAYRVESH